MIRTSLRLAATVTFFLSLLTPLSAQEKPAARADDEYRQFFKKPETTADFWKAINFEMEVGRFDLAAKLLHELLDKKPDNRDFLPILEKEGLSAFLRLRNVPRWSEPLDLKVQNQAKRDVEDLITQVTTALKEHLQDPDRIAKYIKNLAATPEERDFAVKELHRSGTAAMPHLLDALRSATGDERAYIVYAVERMSPDTVPCLLAALDADDAVLQGDLIDILHRRADRRAVPWLWYLSVSPATAEPIREKATRALSYLLETPASKLPPAKVALATEAEKYFQHKVKFADPSAVTVWRWDGNRVVKGWPGAETVPALLAEEYYGLRYARQALALDPTYEPAQHVFLSLALERAQQKIGLDQPLSKGAPDAHAMLATTNPALINAVLERGLAERRREVILGAVRALGDLNDVRSGRAQQQGEPALVRALNYPDPRVQIAAVDALVRLPHPPTAMATSRIVEVCRRAVAGEPGAGAPPKVLLALADRSAAVDAAQVLEKAGFQAVRVATGREAMKRVKESADLDALIIDERLPDPGFNLLLAQLRADVHAGLVPILVLTAPERVEVLRRNLERYKNLVVVSAGTVLDEDELKRLLPTMVREAFGERLDDPLRKQYAERSLEWLARMARGELAGFDVRPAGDAVLQALQGGMLDPKALSAAVEIAGRLPGAKVQAELAAYVLDAGKPVELRTLAAQQLVRHIQHFGRSLSAPQIASIDTLVADGGTDPALRNSVALVQGAMRPNARLTGERLRGFMPPVPGGEK